MRLTHVIGAFVAGGAERFVVSLVKRFQTIGFDVQVIALSPRTDAAGHEMNHELQVAGVPVYVGPTLKVGPATVAWYASQLYSNRDRIVHLHTPNTELIHWLCARPRRLFGPLFRTIHSTAAIEGYLPGIARRRNRPECSIACSAAVRATMTAPSYQTIVTIPNGTEFRAPLRSHVLQEAALKKLGLDPSATHFVCVGRMAGTTTEAAPKAHDILIKAWKRGQLSARGGQLHLLGDGPLRAALERLADNDDSIQFHGTTSKVDEFLCAADVFVMPSRVEGLPIAAIEAVGAGLIAIFSDIPPLRELDAPIVSYVAVDSVDQLSLALNRSVGQRIFVDPKLVLSFREKYSIARTANSYKEVYETYG